MTDPPPYWFNKVNRTEVTFDHPTPPGDVNFFHTDMVSQVGEDFVIYYYQDSSYTTHVSICAEKWDENTLHCSLEKNYTHSGYIHSFTTAFFTDQEGWNYYYIISFEDAKNVVHIYDFRRQKKIA